MQAPRLIITKRADASTVSAGSQVGFQITVYNDSPQPVSGITLTDTLPTKGGMAWRVEVNNFGQTCGPVCFLLNSPQLLTCAMYEVPAAGACTIHVTSRTTSQSVGTLVSTATLAPPVPPPGCTTCSATAGASVTAR